MAQENRHFPQIGEDELVMGALLGDVEAFDELVRRYRAAVIAVAEGELGSREAAEDVAQEAFLLAFKALPQLDEVEKFGGWLCAITRHRARRVGARESRSQATEPTELDRLILAQSQELQARPEDALERDADLATVTAALAELPAEFRTVLRLYYYEEWTVARIGEFLSLPITTIKWRLHRGRELLRRRLNQEKGKTDDGEPVQPGLRPEGAVHAAADRADGAGCQPHGHPPAGRPHFRAPI